MKSNNKKNIIILIIASVISVLISLFTGFIIPRELDYTAFSNFKVFTFYLAYIPLLHFGVVDGLLIKYSRIDINQIDKKHLIKMLYKFVALQIAIGVLGFFIGSVLINIQAIYLYVILMVPFLNIAAYMSRILIILERFNIYATFNLILKVILSFATILIIIMKSNNYIYLITAYFIASIVQIAIGFIVLKKNRDNLLSASSYIQNSNLVDLSKIGFPIVLFYFIYTLVFGIDRIFIEFTESEYTYAMYAFAYSLITIVLTVLESVNTFVFTRFLRSTNVQQESYNQNFKILINALFLVAAVFLVFVNLIVKLIVPSYLDSIRYIYMLFPVIFLKLQFSLRIWPNINKNNIGIKVILNSSIVLLIGLLLNSIVLLFNLDVIYYAFMTIITFILFNIVMEYDFKKISFIKADIIWYMSLIVVTASYLFFSQELYILLVIYTLLIIILEKKELKEILNTIRKR
ncbi:MAG: hypothetical protein RBQ97_06595 [Acholeplasma sp.]|nr:hypothetical protein [Acholeplasma sp.]